MRGGAPFASEGVPKHGTEPRGPSPWRGSRSPNPGAGGQFPVQARGPPSPGVGGVPSSAPPWRHRWPPRRRRRTRRGKRSPRAGNREPGPARRGPGRPDPAPPWWRLWGTVGTLRGGGTAQGTCITPGGGGVSLRWGGGVPCTQERVQGGPLAPREGPGGSPALQGGAGGSPALLRGGGPHSGAGKRAPPSTQHPIGAPCSRTGQGSPAPQ